MDDAATTGEWSAEFETDARTRNDPDKPVELSFLLQLRDNPDDLAMRMVFADWLEQTAQTQKAEAVRLLAEVPIEGSPTMTRLRLLGTTLDPEWMAIVSRAPIDKCPTSNPQFRYQCPKSWESLTSTDDATIRFCNQCNKNVYFCSSLGDVRTHALDEHCVAFSPSLSRVEALREYEEGGDIEMGSIDPYWEEHQATAHWEPEEPTNPGFAASPFPHDIVMGEVQPPASPEPSGDWDEITNPE